MTFRMSDMREATRGVHSDATVHVSIDGGQPIPAIGMACTSADALVCARMQREPSIRGLYRVACPEHTQGILLVISDSPEGAASFLQLHLRDQYWISSVAGNGFYGTYLVCPLADDVGAGIWLSGYDSSDDMEAVLRPTAPDYDKVNPFPLWGPQVTVKLEEP